MNGKIVILGAGHVGSHIAMSLAFLRTCSEIVLVDKLHEKAEAQASDISDSLSSFAEGTLPIVRSGLYSDCADADVTVCAVGEPRKPGQTRLDLLDVSVRMIDELTSSLEASPPRGIVISITNPCDIIADHLRVRLGMDREKCFGTGTLLDTARLVRILSEQTGIARNRIRALVMGEHGDSSMIPFSYISLDGKPAQDFKGFDPVSALDRTHGIGMDIIEGKGSTEFGIGRSCAALITQILSGVSSVLPLSVHLKGEYGFDGISCGVPCLIGPHGIERIIEIPMTEEEKNMLGASIDVLQKYNERVRKRI